MYFAVDWTKRIDFDLLRRERTKSLNEQIRKHGLDALLCFKAENLRYMMGYRPLWWPISFLTRNAWQWIKSLFSSPRADVLNGVGTPCIGCPRKTFGPWQPWRIQESLKLK
jgi:hypothetical protein